MAWKRSALAFASGVGTMLVALEFRDHGLAALGAWPFMGALGMAALFVKSLEQ